MRFLLILALVLPLAAQIRNNQFVAVPSGVNVGTYEFCELTVNGTDCLALKSPDLLAAPVTWTLPGADAVGCFQSDGAGIMSIQPCGGAGTSPPFSTGTTIGESDGTELSHLWTTYSSNAVWHAPFWIQNRARGTKSAPTAVASGDTIGTWRTQRHNGTLFEVNTQMETFYTSVNGGGYTFSVWDETDFQVILMQGDRGGWTFGTHLFTGQPNVGEIGQQAAPWNASHVNDVNAYDRLHAPGNVTSDLIPLGSNFYSLGESANRWNQGWFSSIRTGDMQTDGIRHFEVGTSITLYDDLAPGADNAVSLGFAGSRWENIQTVDIDIHTGLYVSGNLRTDLVPFPGLDLGESGNPFNSIFVLRLEGSSGGPVVAADGIATDDHIYPQTNLTTRLGLSSLNRWSQIWTGDIDSSGTSTLQTVVINGAAALSASGDFNVGSGNFFNRVFSGSPNCAGVANGWMGVDTAATGRIIVCISGVLRSVTLN